MALALSSFAWIVLPVGLWMILKPLTANAVPFTAIGISITLMAVSQWLQSDTTLRTIATDQTQVYKDTYYVVKQGYYLQWLSLSYLLVALLTAIIARSARRRTPRLMASGFWMYHFGLLAIVLQPVISAAFMPRRYIDYQASFSWMERLNFVSGMLSFLGFGLLVLLTFSALIQTLLRRKT